MPNRFELTFYLEDSLVPSKDLYARLELLTPELIQNNHPAPSAASSPGWVPARWRQWGHALLRFFTGSQEPRITVKRGLDGQPFYEIYDPIDGRRWSFSTEREVRVWLEERYYQ